MKTIQHNMSIGRTPGAVLRGVGCNGYRRFTATRTGNPVSLDTQPAQPWSAFCETNRTRPSARL